MCSWCKNKLGQFSVSKTNLLVNMQIYSKLRTYWDCAQFWAFRFSPWKLGPETEDSSDSSVSLKFLQSIKLLCVPFYHTKYLMGWMIGFWFVAWTSFILFLFFGIRTGYGAQHSYPINVEGDWSVTLTTHLHLARKIWICRTVRPLYMVSSVVLSSRFVPDRKWSRFRIQFGVCKKEILDWWI